jgi:hypothetical protein
MKFRVNYVDTFDNCESEEQAYDALLEYLRDVVREQDVGAFNFELIEK